MTNSIIAISFTPSYFVPAATTLQSILKSLSADATLEVICLLTEDIPERMINELEALAGEKATFRFLNLKGQLGDVYVDPRYSEAASYRLMMPELLPEYDKVIYIDCDIIVRNDLAELFENIDLGANYLAAVYEAPIENQSERFEAIGCNPLRYFNSGFLIMNLAKMREDKVSGKLIDALKVDYLEFPDQDALNQVCQGRVLGLSPIYNSIRTFFLPQYKDCFLKQYSEEDWKAVQTHGTVHYTGGKPWNVLAVNSKEWWDCYSSLPNEIKKEWEMPFKRKSLSLICRSLLLNGVIVSAQSLYRKIKYCC